MMLDIFICPLNYSFLLISSSLQLWWDEETEKEKLRLQFSPEIHREVDRYIREEIGGPYLAVHWRTENAPNPLMKCAQMLIPYIQQKFKARLPTTSVRC